MKKLILSLIFAVSVIASFGQAGSTLLSGVFLRVNDSTTYQTAAAARHSSGYADIYFNNQATTPHFDIWDGSAYQHVFNFNGGSGGGSVVSVTGDGVDNTDPTNPIIDLSSSRTVTGTGAIAQDDHMHIIYFDSGTPFNFTIDQLLINTQVTLINKGAGTVTLIAGTGITTPSLPITMVTDKVATVLYGSVTAPSIIVGASGDVVGPSSAVNNRVVFFDGVTGKLIKDSGLTLSGTNTGDQTTITGNAGTATALQTARTIGTVTGDATSAGSSFDGTANNTNALTLATVNSNVGTFGSATTSLTATVNGKGLITAISSQTVTPAVGSITGLGTGVGTWLATPSWTNFNSAITGTAPFWSLATGGTLTGVNTVTSNTANQFGMTGTITATAQAQYLGQFGGAWTGRASQASDDYFIYNVNPSLTAGASGGNDYGAALAIQPTWSGTWSNPVAVYVNTTGTTAMGFQASNSTGTTNKSYAALGSGGGNSWAVDYQGKMLLGNNGTYINIHSGAGTVSGLNDKHISFATLNPNLTGSAYNWYFRNVGITTDWIPTSGNTSLFRIEGINLGNGRKYSPTSGSHALTMMEFVFDFNTSGSYSGTSIGIDYNPTLSSTTGLTHIFSRNTSGSTLIGGTTITASTRVDQRGLGTTSSTINHRWANSSNTVLATLLDDASFNLSGNFVLTTAGNGIYIKEGTNATMGVATLVAGTVVVNTTKVTANSRIMLTRQNLGTITIPVGLAVSARTAGTSFTILSGDLTDTSIIAWQIIEPAP